MKLLSVSLMSIQLGLHVYTTVDIHVTHLAYLEHGHFPIILHQQSLFKRMQCT